MSKHRIRSILSVLLLVAAFPSLPPANAQVTSPEEEFGFPIGADYELVSYAQLQAYWETLARESDRMVLDTIGPTEEGRPQLMGIITSPENHRNLARYKEIARRMALARGVTEAEARKLAGEGKAVVWIDGGLHATEVVGAQQLLELVYRLNSLDDPETLRILDDVIVLAVAANPDGMDLVSEWYYRSDERGGEPEDRSYRGLPVLYHKYAGHDNNRDFYMGNLVETENMLRVQYREWYPQIIYNHHQTGPQGTIIFAPPFRGPPNHFLDPLILTGLDQVGSAMHQRFVREGKGGSTMRSGAGYSVWWNGGLRTTPYYHNSLGLLTEIRGGPIPEEIPFIPARQLPKIDLPLPVEPGVLRHRTAIEYSQTANWAVMDYASRNKDHLLFNRWRMGMNSVEKGSRDAWTVRPEDVYAASDALGGENVSGSPEDFQRFLRDPEERDPRGFVIPAHQADFPTAVKFANALIRNGVEVLRATRAFQAGGTSYPEGSLVVMAAQAYRPHVLDMFEPQDHPNDFAYPGGPPIPPYDATGWTLAFQMGVEFDRILEGFQGPFEAAEGYFAPPAGSVDPSPGAGYLLSHVPVDAFTAVRRLLRDGEKVYWTKEGFSAAGETWPAGTYFVSAGSDTENRVRALARELGVDFHGADETPGVEAMELTEPRIGLWDRYGGSMPSGWLRFILEEFDFDYELVFPPELDAGDLAGKYDVLIFPDGAIPSASARGSGRYSRYGTPDPQEIPAEYRDRLGSVSVDTTIPRLREFLEEGGTIITLERSTSLGFHLDLPVRDYLVDEEGTPYRPEEFFVPGSLLEIRVDPHDPASHGLEEEIIVNFARSPVFGVEEGAPGIRVLGHFQDATPLRSGWAWGQEKLRGGAALLEASVGEGTLFMFGPQLTYRAQTHETFPYLFNGILLSASRDATME
jgi:hypothetical protein